MISTAIMGVIGAIIYFLAIIQGIKMTENIRKDKETALRCLFLREESKKALRYLFSGGFLFSVGYGLAIISLIFFPSMESYFETIINVTAILGSVFVFLSAKNLAIATSTPKKESDY